MKCKVVIKMQTKYYAPSVDTAARILKYLSRYKTKISTLTEISTALEINKSTCLRILKTLEAHNLVYYDSFTKKYSLGIYTAVLGSRAYETLDYLQYLRPYLKEAAEKSGLTAAFVQRISNNRMMFVAKEGPKNGINLDISIGNKFPITEVSYGKWLLAYMSNEEREEFLSNGLKKITKYSITDPQLYLDQLDAISKSKVLVSIDEYKIGITAISSPIMDHSNNVLGVVALIGLTASLTNGEIENISTILKGVTEQCSLKFAGASIPDMAFFISENSI